MHDLPIDQLETNPWVLLKETLHHIIDPNFMSFQEGLSTWLNDALRNPKKTGWKKGERDALTKLFFDYLQLTGSIMSLRKAEYASITTWNKLPSKTTNNCIKAIHLFLSVHPIEKVRSSLWDALTLALSIRKSVYNNWLARSNLLSLYHNLLYMTEAAHKILILHQPEKPAK